MSGRVKLVVFSYGLKRANLPPLVLIDDSVFLHDSWRCAWKATKIRFLLYSRSFYTSYWWITIHDGVVEKQLIFLITHTHTQDLPNAMNAAEITDKLGLHSLRNRNWYIQATCATSGDGLYEGLDWLSQQLKSQKWRDLCFVSVLLPLDHYCLL